MLSDTITSSNMSLLQTVKSLICLKQHIEQKRRRLKLLLQRLQKSVVAEEIFGEVERTVREYEEEGVCLKQQIEQKSRILKLLLQPVIKLHRADLLPVCEEEVNSPQHQEMSINLVQMNPEPPQIQVEREELSMKSHTENNGFRCTVCGNGFGYKGHLNRHMRIHTGEKPYVCTVCKQRFNRKELLKTHMRFHTGGKKPYACTKCGQRFCRKSSLNRHMRRTQRGPDEVQNKEVDGTTVDPRVASCSRLWRRCR